MKARILMALAGCALAAAMLGCSKQPNGPAMGHVDLRLTDAPGDFEHVNIVVTEVSIHRSGGGWERLETDSTTFDLIQLQNGVDTTLASAEVPAGHYTQIRLVLGQGSNLVVNGETHPLEIPSGTESGFKLLGPFDVPEGGTIDMTVDFNAARSVIKNTDGTYMLRPVLKLIPATQ